MTSSKIDEASLITAAQCKAGRALLGWSQGDLAKKASVAVSTVADFERGQRTPVPNNLEALRRALESEDIRLSQGGVIFGISHSSQLSSTVPPSELRPIRWIDETALHSWAARIDARQLLPELVRRLLLARFGYGAEIRFPSGDSIQLRGWDGITNLKSDDALIPSGQAAWEMGVNEDPRRKADSDYSHRTANPGSMRPFETTFIFVTPRSWGTKDEWVKARQTEKKWRDVRVIDAVDLVQLLEQSPAVALWLANQTNLIPPNMRLLKDAWTEWSLSTALPLSESLILSGRDDESTEIHRWLNGLPAIIAIQAESTSEAIAFLYASISEYPTAMRDAIESRVLVAGSEDTAREIANVPLPLILVASELDPGVASLMVSKGHHVFLAYGSAIGAPIDVRTLSRPDRYTIAEELKALRLSDNEANILARDSGRSLTVLRRLMKAAPGQRPPLWARSDQARKFLPILLAGAWDEKNELDRKVVSRLAGISYNELCANLTAGLLLTESPVRNVGSIWKIASPRDAWFRLAPYLTASDIQSFKEIALEVLEKSDPAFAREGKELFSFEEKGSDTNSSYLKQGLVETITLLGVFGDQHPTVPNLRANSDHIVHKLLNGADAKRWWSLADHLSELAEASPEEFLRALDDGLAQNDQSIMALFKERADGFFGRTHHAHLLWALEMLAWSPDYLARVTSILLKLSELVPKKQSGNHPAESLRHIYVLWHPQTYVNQDDRLLILDSLRQAYETGIWNLLLSLYPTGHDSASDTSRPRWRTFDEPLQTEPVTNRSIWVAAIRLGDWLVDAVGLNPNRWEELIHRFSDFAPELRSKLLKLAQKLPPEMKLDSDRSQVRNALRECIHRHRRFGHTDWAIPEQELVQLESVHSSLESTDLIARHRWLFESHQAQLLQPPNKSWQDNEIASREARRAAMEEIFQHHGIAGAKQLAEAGVAPGLVGQALADTVNDPTIVEVLNSLFREQHQSDLEIGFGFVATLSERKEKNWPSVIIDQGLRESWGAKSLGYILSALPQTAELHMQINQFATNVQDSYWNTINPYRFDENAENFSWIAKGLLEHGRAIEAAQLLVGRNAQVDSTLIVAILDGILATQDRLKSSNNDATMFQYYVEQLFLRFDKDESFNQSELSRLEWAFLKVLDSSSRPPTALHHQLATVPSFFSEVISAIYRAKDASQEELNNEERDRQEIVASNAYTLLHSWREIPGTIAGSVKYDLLERWFREARELCVQAGRGEIAEEKIGEVLAHAPEDTDGTWPCVPVRKLIETMRSSHLETGFYIGTRNKRGVTSRGILDGGELERQEAARYREYERLIRLQWPRTAAILERIARSYDLDAKEHDHDAERRQWT